MEKDNSTYDTLPLSDKSEKSSDNTPSLNFICFPPAVCPLLVGIDSVETSHRIVTFLLLDITCGVLNYRQLSCIYEWRRMLLIRL